MLIHLHSPEPMNSMSCRLGFLFPESLNSVSQNPKLTAAAQESTIAVDYTEKYWSEKLYPVGQQGSHALSKLEKCRGLLRFLHGSFVEKKKE